jgi:aminomuconate-semialdehyde/2-hydroxymuconate-6-semialdehyde dehydrogenase
MITALPEPSIHTITHYINGQFIAHETDDWMGNVHPASGTVYGKIACANAKTVKLAVDAASAAFPAWSASGAAFRSECMLKLAALMERDLELLARIESFDNGKPLKVALTVDIPRSISNIRFFATAILHQSTDAHQTDETTLNYTLRQPFGAVACISPWNLPLYLFTWKIAPALAAGNTVVAKPSELTPATAFYFSKLCTEAGMPPGVLNVLHGPGAPIGEPLVIDQRIKAVSFTGGTQTGALIAQMAAPHFKKTSLELGGKNATLVFADCDFEKTVSETVRAAFSNQGQICLCGSRIYVERSIYEAFKISFVEKVKKLKVGMPEDESAQLAAIVSEAHMNKILSYIKLAQDEGGVLLHGGNRIDDLGNGYFIEPTVFEALDPYCRTNQEEIFGPVVTLFPFDNDEEAITYANATDYGLAFSIWTSNISRAQKLAGRLQSGIVWINCWMLRDLRTPFGGVKNSGMGREGGWEALRFFTEAKNVCVKG